MQYRALLPLCAAVPLLAVCARNEESLIVVGAPSWPDGGGCVVDAGASVFMSQGFMDLAFETPYTMPAVLLNNTLTRTATKTNGGIDANEMQLTGASIELDLPQLPDVIAGLEQRNEALVAFDVTLASVSLGSGEKQGVGVEIIPQPTAKALAEALSQQFPDQDVRTTLVATVVFKASRSGNVVGKIGEIEAREFTFPVQLCFGCLVSYAGCPADYVPQDSGRTQWSGGVCGNAQDTYLWPAECEAPS